METTKVTESDEADDEMDETTLVPIVASVFPRAVASDALSKAALDRAPEGTPAFTVAPR